MKLTESYTDVPLADTWRRRTFQMVCGWFGHERHVVRDGFYLHYFCPSCGKKHNIVDARRFVRLS